MARKREPGAVPEVEQEAGQTSRTKTPKPPAAPAGKQAEAPETPSRVPTDKAKPGLEPQPPTQAKPETQASAAAAAPEAEEKFPLEPQPPLVVGVGASAGGLEAFTDLLRHLPRDTGMAFVLLQHLPPKQHSMLAQILGKATLLPVAEAREGTAPEPDHVYILPPGEMMVFREGALRLERREATEGRYLPVDTFLTSLAEERGGQAIGVILSGTASDGVQGLKAIKEVGGITFAQEPRTAKYSGMPESSMAAGCVDFVLAPEGIARELARIARHPYVSPALEGELLKPEDESVFGTVLNLLRRSSGVDFTYYKHSTIKRRMLRRMALQRIERLGDYLNFLRDHPDEVSALYTDILINVTSFFRDPEVFEELKSSVFPALLKGRAPDAPIRLWVPGCSTGEEVYSLAVSLLEFFRESGQETPLQIFGTDIDGPAIDVARAGRYPEHIAENVSPERLRRFFVKADSGYQIHKAIRDRCTFARQNLIKDPPFSHLDLISCRNVLIYLGPVLQKRIIPIFHFALKTSGFLLLGKSEAIGAFQEMFTVVDKKHKIYVRKELPGRVPLQFAMEENPQQAAALPPRGVQGEAPPASSLDLLREADRIVLARFAPAGVIVDEALKIMQFRGHTGPFLEPMAGEASLNLLRLLRESLRPEVGAALHHAIKSGTPVRKQGLKVQYNGQSREVNVEVFPVSPQAFQERFYLVVFEDVTGPAPPRPEKLEGRRGRSKAATKDQMVKDLELELAATKEYLQATIEEQEATLEELKSTNEEIMSSNEELQTLNEEMEASKEELQSANEELATMNEELENRNAELARVNDDLENLLGSVNIPIVFLDQNLCIRRFNAMAKEVLHLIPTDAGRPLGDIKIGLEIDDLEGLLREALDGLKMEVREVQDRRGLWYALQIRPYKTAQNQIEGLVLSLADIDALKRALDEAREARNYAQAIVETLREPLLILDGDLRVRSANRSFYHIFGVTPPETESQLIYELGNQQWDIPELRRLLEEILPHNAVLQDFVVEHEFPSLGARSMLLNARRFRPEDRGRDLILLAIEDITARCQAEIRLKESEQKLRDLNVDLMVAQECERQEVSFALHEELAQDLTALKLRIGQAEKLPPANHGNLKSEVVGILAEIDGMIKHVRAISQGLRPEVLDLGMAPAIRQLLDHFSQYFKVEYGIKVENLDELFLPQTRVMIYRILQEALVNVVKHAEATQVSLVIKPAGDKISFLVADNGRGFQRERAMDKDLGRELGVRGGPTWLVGGVPFVVSENGRDFKPVEHAAGTTKMGLAVMEERVRMLGGTLEIASQEKEGTRVSFTIPPETPEG